MSGTRNPGSWMRHFRSGCAAVCRNYGTSTTERQRLRWPTSETQDGRTEIPLTFPAKGSVFVIFERPAERHLAGIEKDGNTVFPSIHQGYRRLFERGSRIRRYHPGDVYRNRFRWEQDHLRCVKPADPDTPAAMAWTLSFPSGWGAPASVPVEHFQSWTESTDPGIRYFSGTAVYRTTLQIPAGFVTPAGNSGSRSARCAKLPPSL